MVFLMAIAFQKTDEPIRPDPPDGDRKFSGFVRSRGKAALIRAP